MEHVILVDIHDNVLGAMEKIEAHRKAKLHRAVSAFIFNTKGQMLLQRRALSKYHSPGLWTNTACTHPRPNEKNKDAAARRLKEEMGLHINKLTKVFDFIYKAELDNELTEHELDHVFIGFSDDIPIPEPEEVGEFKYVDTDQLMTQIENKPEEYTVWFKKIVERVLIHLNQLTVP